ncbi:hypothetical protein Poli38472_008078 [Pythium oligandrum]|uniref:Transmembrane protein n=1 Tax=Pythium oligandrum TaxID=41045 RepID=A0A8K1CKT1_PYTOL|nr:hypothetical protein Poli38472_008078 [Pythium oligandrum]|eukprot:TMW65436.1 hypothetical protein Poli38472_008078 [Pythium oligandrum]
MYAQRPKHQHRGIVLLEDPDLAGSYPYDGQYDPLNARTDCFAGLTDAVTPDPTHLYGGIYDKHPQATPFGKLPIPPPAPSSAGTSISNNSGALRSGGPIRLCSRDQLGYMLNWLLIGFFNGSIPALVYPLFGDYLHLEAFQGNGVLALIDFAWNFKFIFSFLTDCTPLNRYRRKPYLMIGWSLLTVFLLIITILSQVEPYRRDGEIVNKEAPTEGLRYVVPFIIISFARIIVIVPSEGIMVEYAQREGLEGRGRTQAITLMVRGVGQAIGKLLVSFGCYSSEYGGTFTASLPLRAVFGLWTALAAAGIAITWFLMSEEQMPTSSQPFRSQIQRVWRIIQQRTTWQIMVFGFFQNAVMSLHYSEREPFFRMRLGGDGMALNNADAVAAIGSVIAAYILSRFFLNTNWRKIMLWSLLITVVLEVPVESITIFDRLPTVAIFGIKDFLVSIPYALIAFMREFVIIEITDPGYEATTFGFITTVQYLAKPFVSMLNNLFATDQDDLADDTSEVRWRIATEMWIIYAVRVVVILSIYTLLPRQKRHALERKLRGNPNLVVPLVIFICVCIVFWTAVTASFLAVIHSTSCLKFAGGKGCL